MIHLLIILMTSAVALASLVVYDIMGMLAFFLIVRSVRYLRWRHVR